MWYEILRPFVNELTADDKYSGTNTQNLPHQFPTPLYHKQKTSSGFFFCISEMCIKFRAFSKEDEYPSLIISEIIDAEIRGYLNV